MISSFQSGLVSRLVKVSGIVVAASGVKARAQSITVMCRSCQVRSLTQLWIQLCNFFFFFLTYLQNLIFILSIPDYHQQLGGEAWP